MLKDTARGINGSVNNGSRISSSVCKKEDNDKIYIRCKAYSTASNDV